MFDFVPLTFVLDSDSDNFISDLTLFSNVFDKHQEISDSGDYANLDILDELRELLAQKYSIFGKDLAGNFTPESVPSAEMHLSHANLWILKLTQLNRGRGIYVINTISQLLTIINE